MAHLLLHGTLDATILEADTLTPRACALAPSLMHAAAPDAVDAAARARGLAPAAPDPLEETRIRAGEGGPLPEMLKPPACLRTRHGPARRGLRPAGRAPRSPLGRALASTRRRGRAARRNPGPSERGMRGEVPRGSGRRGLPVLRAGGWERRA